MLFYDVSRLLEHLPAMSKTITTTVACNGYLYPQLVAVDRGSRFLAIEQKQLPIRTQVIMIGTSCSISMDSAHRLPC